MRDGQLAQCRSRHGNSKMNDARTIAWIFYAIAGASGRAPADYRAISSVADGINHAVPTHKELQSSISWLAEAGLVLKTAGGYAISSKGMDLMSRAQGRHDTVMKVWEFLTEEVSRMRASPEFAECNIENRG